MPYIVMTDGASRYQGMDTPSHVSSLKIANDDATANDASSRGTTRRSAESVAYGCTLVVPLVPQLHERSLKLLALREPPLHVQRAEQVVLPILADELAPVGILL